MRKIYCRLVSSTVHLLLFQSTILNLLTSELVVINNPLVSDDYINGACLLDTHCIIYGPTEWVLLSMQGSVIERHHEKLVDDFEVLTMDFRSLDEYNLTMWSGNLDDKRIIFQSQFSDHRTSPIYLSDAMVVNDKRDLIFACSTQSKPDVTLYKLTTGRFILQIRLASFIDLT